MKILELYRSLISEFNLRYHRRIPLNSIKNIFFQLAVLYSSLHQNQKNTYARIFSTTLICSTHKFRSLFSYTFNKH